jgi:two-component system, OmpR family, alkaline phosphatase synthesis response regulator PhoP
MENVLVVDDESDILTLVSANLQIRGYQVAKAKNGTEALAQLRLSPPNLMVLDIKLPDFSGWDLLKGIKVDPKITSRFPVLIMTASISETNIDLESYPSVVEILIKPFSTSRLLSAVERALGHR